MKQGFGFSLRLAGAGLAAGVFCGATNGAAAQQERADPAPAAASAALHVPSPDWRDQVIYFAMIDRFADGDRRNNDQGQGEFDPASRARYSGGDLAGLAERLEYIRGLGATALWITPPVAHRWWDDSTHYGGYHGYWTDDFMAVDRHFGALEDLRRLSSRLHAAGMFLVQDIVLNHTGNYFRYPGAWDPAAPQRGYVPNPDAAGRTAPARWPFTLNDARDPKHRAASIYHWTPVIRDGGNRAQELSYQLADLDDIDTGNPVVRRALRESYGYWIREAGVDAFRIDTAFYVPQDFLVDFLSSPDAGAPGVLRVAEATGRAQFHVFGEGFGIDTPYADAQARKIESYMRDADGAPLLPGMLNFPLYGTTLDVFARGRATAAMSHRIRSMMALHRRPHLMPTFVDNHDVDRFLAGGTRAGLQQALLLIMTLPGIPTIYYGTEQELTGQRQAMFAAGYGAGGRDRFDTGAPLYRYIRGLADLRRAHRLFSRGVPDVLADNAAGPGVLAYRMAEGDAAALVVFNSADREALLDNLDTGVAAGRVLEGAFGIHEKPADLVAGKGGRITISLPPRSGMVWLVGPRTRKAAPAAGHVAIDALPDAPVESDLRVTGTARGVERLRLVVDGDLATATEVRPGSDGRWAATLDTASMIDPGIAHRLVAWSAAGAAVSAPRTFRVARRWALLAEARDPRDDDRGAKGSYLPPAGPGWDDRHPLDLLGVRVWGSGGAIRIELRLRDVIAPWNPPNGFDHVAFTLFLALPGAAHASAVMPLQNATLPDAMRWSHRLRAHGWSNALYSAEGASATEEGAPIVPGADIRTDREAGTITFTLPAAALGNPRTLSGARLYANTWDYDGGYRALVPASAQAFGFRGGDGTRDPLVMDDIAVITLP